MAEKRKDPCRPSGGVKSGYEKLAFGGVNDAVLLLSQSELTPAQIKKLDLYGVAGIKKGKDGIEIKFYDRMKALECLRSLSESGEEQSPLYRALMQSVRSAGKENEDGV